VTIHSEHPFLPPPQDRSAVRRWRGRLPAPVTVWATGSDASRAGLTVSSVLVADGEPSELLALVDPDSDFGERVLRTGTAAVSVLGPDHRAVADVLAGQAPSPGGPFRTGEWTDSAWGPVLVGASAWAGVRLLPGDPATAGWSLLLRGRIEHLELAADDPHALAYLRGRYRVLGDDPR
jgi:flavin reductase (DIM6/NTAB) family NADH-FMN oxidoreductase RutF